jgi:hypothetical protein
MTSVIVGGLGIGAMWGWVTGSLARGVTNPRITWPAATASTVAAAAAVGALGRGGAAGVAFGVATVVTATGRAGWERWLRRRGVA